MLTKTPKYLRQGQTIINFISWLKTEKNLNEYNLFMLKDKKLNELYNEYIKSTIKSDKATQ